jgi:hypothetical protein
MHNKHKYGPKDIAIFLLHPIKKGRRGHSLENIYIQLFLQHNTIINEQSQKDENPLFDLIYYVQLKHACA